jgi:hypothetical protein
LREGEAATSPATLSWARKHFAKLRAPVGAGSDCNFCELNREHALGRFALADADFVFWSVNPQVHAFDHLSIMETLEAQAATVQSARNFAGNRPLVISPVTLKQRFNPVATDSQAPTAPGELPPQVDTRQLSRFAAAWTLGSIASLASAGTESVTFYETTGWRGVMEREAGSPLPDKFPSSRGEVFPLFHAFDHIAGFQRFAIVRSSDSTKVNAISLFESGDLRRTLVANLTPFTQNIRINPHTRAARKLTLPPCSLTAVIEPV